MNKNILFAGVAKNKIAWASGKENVIGGWRYWGRHLEEMMDLSRTPAEACQEVGLDCCNLGVHSNSQ